MMYKYDFCDNNCPICMVNVRTRCKDLHPEKKIRIEEITLTEK